MVGNRRAGLHPARGPGYRPFLDELAHDWHRAALERLLSESLQDKEDDMFRPRTGGSGFLPKRGSCLHRHLDRSFKQDGQEANKDRAKVS